MPKKHYCSIGSVTKAFLFGDLQRSLLSYFWGRPM